MTVHVFVYHRFNCIILWMHYLYLIWKYHKHLFAAMNLTLLYTLPGIQLKLCRTFQYCYPIRLLCVQTSQFCSSRFSLGSFKIQILFYPIYYLRNYVNKKMGALLVWFWKMKQLISTKFSGFKDSVILCLLFVTKMILFKIFHNAVFSLHTGSLCIKLLKQRMHGEALWSKAGGWEIMRQVSSILKTRR